LSTTSLDKLDKSEKRNRVRFVERILSQAQALKIKLARPGLKKSFDRAQSKLSSLRKLIFLSKKRNRVRFLQT
jgi:hypothetical protein